MKWVNDNKKKLYNFKQRINFMDFYGRHLACASAFVQME